MKKITAYITGIVFSMIAVSVFAVNTKPSKTFDLFYNTSLLKNPNTIILLQCFDESCNELDTLKVRSEDVVLTGNSLIINSTSFRDYARLVFEFDDRIIQSNIFGRSALHAKYKATINDTEISVQETSSFLKRNTAFANFAKSFLLIAVSELVVAFIIFRKRSISLKELQLIPVLNLVTVTIYWFVLSRFSLHDFLQLLIAFCIALLIDAFAFQRVLKTPIKDSIVLSLLTNIVSTVVAVVLLSYWHFA